MNYVIAIPSHNRALDINRQTLKMLDYYAIDWKKVFIFVDKTEYHQYSKFLKYPATVIEGKLGIKENRKAISDYFKKDQYIVSIDDDVTHLLKLKICQTGKNRLDKCSDLKLFIKETIDKMNEENITLCGLYPIENPFFMKNLVSLDCRFIIGNFKIFKNKKILENRKFTLLEDYETTMKYFFYSGKVLRFNNMVASTKYNILKWGLKEDDKIKEVNMFYQKYKSYSNITIKAKTIDIRLRDTGFNVLSSLWIGRKLNQLSKMCIKSWVKCGYSIDLYVDQLTENDFPDDLIPFIHLIDYKEIKIDYENKNILQYSDYWRFNLLKQKIDTTWIDADMFLLDRVPTTDIIISSEHTFQSGAYKSHQPQVSNIGVLRFNNNEGQMFLSELIEKINKKKINDDSCIYMNMFRKLLKKNCYNNVSRYIYQPFAFCPVPWWCCREIYNTDQEFPTKYSVEVKRKDFILKNSIGIHLWNNFTYNKHKIDFYNIDNNCFYNKLLNYYN